MTDGRSRRRGTVGQRWGWIEIAVGIALIAVIVTAGHTLIIGCLKAVFGAAVSAIALLRVDTAPTAWSLALAAGRIGLAILPSLMLLRMVGRRRWLWLLPLLAALAIVSLPVSLTACPTLGRWALLAVLSATATALVRVPLLRWTVVAPYLVLLEVVPSHGLLHFADVGTRDPAYRDQLLATCARNDGQRPVNLIADRLMPYHGINAIGDELVFLAGEGPDDGGMRDKSGGRRVGSWWLRRTGDGLAFAEPSGATGNLWRGCLIDDTLWMVRARRLVGVRRLTGSAERHEELSSISVPSTDMDLLEAACDGAGRRVFVTEFFEGGMWEVPLDGGAPRRHHVGGVLLIPKWRFDGRLVLADSSALLVFDPAAGRVIERVPARLGGHGVDVCDATGAAAVADLAGRLRVFELDEAGHYRFSWGVSMFAPRRVAFSPDCSRIGVTSADDHRVFIVDAAARRVTDVFRAGPALREIAATGPREFSVSDVCSITTFR